MYHVSDFEDRLEANAFLSDIPLAAVSGPLRALLDSRQGI